MSWRNRLWHDKSRGRDKQEGVAAEQKTELPPNPALPVSHMTYEVRDISTAPKNPYGEAEGPWIEVYLPDLDAWVKARYSTHIHGRWEFSQFLLPLTETEYTEMKVQEMRSRNISALYDRPGDVETERRRGRIKVQEYKEAADRRKKPTLWREIQPVGQIGALIE